MKPNAYSRDQLIQKASLTTEDLAEVNRCRGDYNRLGFAYQIGFVRLFNRLPAQQPLESDNELLNFTAIQLEIDVRQIDEYAKRQHTVSDHQTRIRVHLGRYPLGPEQTKVLEAFVFDESFRLEHTSALLRRAEAFLQEQGILRPGDSTLIRIIGEQRRRARAHICAEIEARLPDDVSKALDEVLQLEDGEAVSALQKIKAHPNRPSPEAMLSLTDKLAGIEATGVLNVDLSWLNRNYQRALFHYVRKSSVDRLRRVVQPRRNAALTCFLWQSYRDTVDQMIDMYDKLLTRVSAQAQNDLDDQMKRQRETIREALGMLRDLGEILLDASIRKDELYDRVFEAIPREQLAVQVEVISEWVSGKKSALFYEVARRFGYLRRFSPAFLQTLELMAESEDTQNSCLEALRTLKTLNANNKRKLPEDVPIAFAPKGLLALIQDDQGRISKRHWECALLFQLREEVRSGNIYVTHSKRFGRFDDFFIPLERWHQIRGEFFRRSGLPQDPGEVPAYLHTRLNQAYSRFLQAAPENSYATVDDKGWCLASEASEKLDPASQGKLEQLKAWLAQHMRRIRLPELLIDVDNELGFTKHFMPPALRQERTPEEVCVILATILAYGCNIGSYTMAQLIQGISYRQLKRVSDWQMTEEAQRSALADLVGAIAGLDTSLSWGKGKTSASDGQRFSLRRKVLQQTYSPRFSDFALEFYSFIADNYAPFYSTPIECTDRDAAFVLDGLLYNESELELEEHYTDTHGYTEINFAAFAMLGRRFCPRIRGIQHQRIYRIDADRDYGVLAPLVNRSDRTIDVRLIVQQWDRIGQFYASMESGHTAASVALKRLAAYSTQNRFYRANRELGRLSKTEFILSYMAEPHLRARIRRGLLKVEQLHALARDVYYGRRGRINARELHEQINSCSCLTLILACIIYWQAKEIFRALTSDNPEQDDVDISLLEHVSPIEWDNVILYGQYHIDQKLIR